MAPYLQDLTVSLALIMARVIPFVMTFPYLGGAAVPRFVKAGLILVLSLFWMSQLQTLPAQELKFIGTNGACFAAMIVKEIAIGLILGNAFALFLVPFRIAGEFVGQEMGLTIATISDPTQHSTGTAVGQIFDTLGMLLFFGLDFHHVFLSAFHASFARRPVGAGIGPLHVEEYIQAMTLAQEWGMALVAPIACWLFITSVILALMARAAPQLNIMNVGFVLRLITGFGASIILLPEIAPNFTQIMMRFSRLLSVF